MLVKILVMVYLVARCQSQNILRNSLFMDYECPYQEQLSEADYDLCPLSDAEYNGSYLFTIPPEDIENTINNWEFSGLAFFFASIAALGFPASYTLCLCLGCAQSTMLQTLPELPKGKYILLLFMYGQQISKVEDTLEGISIDIGPYQLPLNNGIVTEVTNELDYFTVEFGLEVSQTQTNQNFSLTVEEDNFIILYGLQLNFLPNVEPKCAVFEGTKCVGCNAGEFLNYEQNTCFEIVEYCNRYVSSGQCAQCISQRTLFNNSCPLTVENCASYDTERDLCQNCRGGFQLVGETCVEEDQRCPDGQGYTLEGNCEVIGSEECEFLSEGVCLTCPEGQAYDEVQGKCSIQCPADSETTKFVVNLGECIEVDKQCGVDRPLGQCPYCLEGYYMSGGLCFRYA